MNLQELQELADKDLKINDTELDIESLKTPQLHNKYCKFLSKFKTLQKQSETDYNRLYKEKWEYYTGKSDPSVYQLKPFNLKILKPDVDKYIKADTEIVKADQTKHQDFLISYQINGGTKMDPLKHYTLLI